jgi:hypothetical protein
MGLFIYDDARAVEIEDRALTHLQLVIIDKLRRGESFALTLSDGDRTLMMWLNPYTALQFVYHGNRRPAVNREWLEELAINAGVTGVLMLVPEPASEALPHGT